MEYLGAGAGLGVVNAKLFWHEFFEVIFFLKIIGNGGERQWLVVIQVKAVFICLFVLVRTIFGSIEAQIIRSHDELVFVGEDMVFNNVTNLEGCCGALVSSSIPFGIVLSLYMDKLLSRCVWTYFMAFY